MASKKRCKSIFILKIENIDDIDNKYKFNINIDNFKEEVLPLNKTEINDLSTNTNVKHFSYMDESKKTHTCNICMVDKNRKCITNVKSSDLKCYWCRNSFITIPIGCPIKYISPDFFKQYYSEITKDKYVIRENIPLYKLESNKDLLEKNKSISVNTDTYYETDGIFCSFNCCLAFINDNYRNPIYNDSKFLLAKIYKELFDIDMDIKPSFSWRLLKEYGGNLTIEQFRNDLYNISYKDTKNFIKKLPIQYPIGYLYEERIKF